MGWVFLIRVAKKRECCHRVFIHFAPASFVIQFLWNIFCWWGRNKNTSVTVISPWEFSSLYFSFSACMGKMYNSYITVVVVYSLQLQPRHLWVITHTFVIMQLDKHNPKWRRMLHTMIHPLSGVRSRVSSPLGISIITQCILGDSIVVCDS